MVLSMFLRRSSTDPVIATNFAWLLLFDICPSFQVHLVQMGPKARSVRGISAGI